MSEQEILTMKEAQAFLKVSRSTIYRLMWSGQLRGGKVGSIWRYYKADLLALIKDTPTTYGLKVVND